MNSLQVNNKKSILKEVLYSKRPLKDFMGSISQLLFARLHFSKKLHHFDNNNLSDINYKKRILLDVIKYETEITRLLAVNGKNAHLRGGFKWNFAGIKTGDDYIYGKLGKSTKFNTLKRDDKTKDYVPTEIAIDNVMVFLINLEQNIIVFESKKDIGHKAPLDIIKDIFNIIHKDKESLELELITDKREIIKRLNRMKFINKICLNVHPTNPHSTDSSEKMDNWLKQGRISRLKIEAHSEDKGIDLENLDLIRSGLYLAQEGHGSGKIDGKIGDKKEKLITGKYPIRKEGNIQKDDEMNIKILLHQIKELIRALEEKINKDV